MATFIDNLAYQLFVIGFAALLIAYLFSYVYLQYRKKSKDIGIALKGAAVPFGVLGAYMIIMGVVGQLTWFLPGAYNILFIDPLLSFGILLVAFAFAIHLEMKLQYIGLLAMFFGFMVIWYGISGYNLELTKEPLALAGMYILFGIAGVFSYPASIVMDRLPGYQKNVWIGWQALLVICWLAFIGAGLLAIFTGASAVPAHLASPP
jgi:putative membrane protein